MPFNSIDVNELYTKDDKLKRDDVLALIEWTKTQPHLPEITELQAIVSLHSCHYQTEAAKTTIDRYFTGRTRYPEYFSSAPEDVIRRVFAVNFIKFLPRRTPDDEAVVLMKILETSPRLYNCVEHIQVTGMVLTLYVHRYGPAEGLVLLSDMAGISFGHLFRVNFSAVKRTMWFLQEAAPVRIKALHYINALPITGKVLSIMKPFMSKEVSEAIKVHTKLETLYDYVPKQCLPEDYGGELPPSTILHEDSAQELVDNLDFFKWHESQTVDESKRAK